MSKRLKIGLILQSLSPLFLLLMIRHFHFAYFRLARSFFSVLGQTPGLAVKLAWYHELFGEMVIFVFSFVWVFFSLLYIPAFAGTQKAGFHSHGEVIVPNKQESDKPAFFLMTFILPLLIDELSSPQYWISYLLVILIVCSVLNKSKLYYQSPVLAILNYYVYEFEVMNPDESDPKGFEKDKKYIGITKENAIAEGTVIKWKPVEDNNVFLIYKEAITQNYSEKKYR